MSKRTTFIYNIDSNKGTNIFKSIENHLKENGFKSIISNHEKVYVSYPTEINFKVKGEFPECIVIKISDTKLTIDAWIYLDTYNEELDNISENGEFNLDPSKEIGLDGHMIYIHKTNLKNKIAEIEKAVKLA